MHTLAASISLLLGNLFFKTAPCFREVCPELLLGLYLPDFFNGLKCFTVFRRCFNPPFNLFRFLRAALTRQISVYLCWEIFLRHNYSVFDTSAKQAYEKSGTL